ncbi:hypothetical protein HPB50_013851 [Hyalomma asiaticum]|uniref:Uncharacterized protein n=1 Tax=Hyalomma asiaticum TaxID=266040 RepID=A0ACB7THX7_HYAAI|nr:hypothetical protein HPB50_013851 [Hyalomma asiaticum]
MGIPAVTVPGRVLAAWATSLNLSHPWNAGLPVWLSLLGTSLSDASSGASDLPQFLSVPTCWQARYPSFDINIVCTAASSESAL